MANKSLFASLFGAMIRPTDARNEAGGVAYARSPKAALAQFAATGCLNATFYASAEKQLADVLAMTKDVEPEFIAKVALHARSKGHMKDMPALLVAVLSVRSPGLMAEVFDRVIDSPKMLRTFVQIMRSGVVGRKSLGTLPKRLVAQWLEAQGDAQIFRGAVGNDPSLADVIRMVHPKPGTPARAALYAYLVGKPFDAAALPLIVSEFEAFKANPAAFTHVPLPEVPMEMFTGLNLTAYHWKALAAKASWQSLRMNLNTFARHGVFDDPAAVRRAADVLRNPQAIAKARVFPYQLLAAFTHAGATVPAAIREALQDAMELATANVPTIDGKVWVLADVSGSMQSPVTGVRKGATSAVRCVDVAALVSATIVRTNRDAGVVPFSDDVVKVTFNPRDSVMTIASTLAALPSGGTNCAAPLHWLNAQKAAGDLVIFVSDNQSWLGGPHGQTTGVMAAWQQFKRRNPRAKLVCLDIQPGATSQAPDRQDILNIGGFADSVFSVISQFAQGTLAPDHWVGVIEKESI